MFFHHHTNVIYLICKCPVACVMILRMYGSVLRDNHTLLIGSSFIDSDCLNVTPSEKPVMINMLEGSL